jgi:POT family proton-dependent oligopeptide transporter
VAENMRSNLISDRFELNIYKVMDEEKVEQLEFNPNNQASEKTTPALPITTETLQITSITNETDIFPRDATEEEIETLRHVIDHIPKAVWVVAFAGAAERFTYYAVTAPWRKFPHIRPPNFKQQTRRLKCQPQKITCKTKQATEDNQVAHCQEP